MSEIYVPLGYAILFSLLITLVTCGVVWWRLNRKAKQFKSLTEAVSETDHLLSQAQQNVMTAEARYRTLNTETKKLQALKANADKLAAFVKKAQQVAAANKGKINAQKEQLAAQEIELHELMSTIDLYSRLNEFTDVGLFEMPEYLYETSERFKEEITFVRKEQQQMVRDGQAVEYPDGIEITGNAALDKKVLNGQIKLLLAAFNIQCDFLIGKINPGNYARTLEQIEKRANTLEKSVADLHCGFNRDYINLKFQECRLQYQYSLKKQEDAEEQRALREQMREEAKVKQEREAAVQKAEEEERVYRDMLARAKEEFAKASDDDKLVAEQRIADLERELAEANSRSARAKSQAELTRIGHVYIISNIGSFGEGIYKIGLTRRLDPMDRVKELSDASVPFIFDVHAIIFAEDAPDMERLLHKKFTAHRVNAVNFRKEFFRVDLESIKNAVEEISNGEADFKMTARAEEFYESRRLRAERDPQMLAVTRAGRLV